MWGMFTIVNGTDSRKVACNICGNEYSRGAATQKQKLGTTCMTRHAKDAHPDEYRALLEGAAPQQEKQKQKQTAGERRDEARQVSIKDAFGNQYAKVWDVKSTRRKAADQQLLKMVVLDNQPFSIVEDQGFIEFVSNLQPLYPLPSHKKLSSLLEPKYDEVCAALTGRTRCRPLRSLHHRHMVRNIFKLHLHLTVRYCFSFCDYVEVRQAMPVTLTNRAALLTSTEWDRQRQAMPSSCEASYL